MNIKKKLIILKKKGKKKYIKEIQKNKKENLKKNKDMKFK